MNCKKDTRALESLYGGRITLDDKTKYSFPLPHRPNTTVSLETNPYLYIKIYFHNNGKPTVFVFLS